MKIRAITLGQKLTTPDVSLQNLKENLIKINELKHNFEAKGIEVEFIRFAAEPFDNITDLSKSPLFKNRKEWIEILDQLVTNKLIGIYSFSPGLCDHKSEITPTESILLQEIPQMIKSHPYLFSSIQCASSANGINISAIEKCIEIIQTLADPNPFSNLQFAVTFNVSPNTPFFPSAYHMGETSKISIALEGADEIISIIQKANFENKPLHEIKLRIQTRFREIYDIITEIVEPFCQKNLILFHGIDFSPAPYPTKEKSIGSALEELGICHFGEFGSVFGVGFLTEAIKSVDRPKIGFSGFMQPLLEDLIIAQRNREGKIDIHKLLLFSTMCGLGLDCIPIPGDFNQNTLKMLLLDIAMISIRLNKPLTARIMPIPNKIAGEMTEFEFEYFANSKICDFPTNTENFSSKFLEINKNYHF